MILTCEEALFLTWSIGCLDIVDDSNNKVPLSELWLLLISAHTLPASVPLLRFGSPISLTFAARYISYHHYRSRGWTVRPGIKFGADWLLYRRTPTLDHAEFAVVAAGQTVSGPRDWTQIHALVRVCQQAKKKLVVCRVLMSIEVIDVCNGPASLLENSTITESQYSRWVPETNR
ncbi:tRNA-intron endonuclease catalytic domain-like protein [Ramicandelaber brevisporus]|nr:tRNA-intron endonuclease catalytic domain-like protein [Ramicandelaber brevisporus]